MPNKTQKKHPVTFMEKVAGKSTVHCMQYAQHTTARTTGNGGL